MAILIHCDHLHLSLPYRVGICIVRQCEKFDRVEHIFRKGPPENHIDTEIRHSVP